MITRPQAEALLTLAEALEACERVGLEFSCGEGAFFMFAGPSPKPVDVGQPCAVHVRLIISKHVPKSTGS